jgi:hypothetical protein
MRSRCRLRPVQGGVPLSDIGSGDLVDVSFAERRNQVLHHAGVLADGGRLQFASGEPAGRVVREGLGRSRGWGSGSPTVLDDLSLAR